LEQDLPRIFIGGFIELGGNLAKGFLPGNFLHLGSQVSPFSDLFF